MRMDVYPAWRDQFAFRINFSVGSAINRTNFYDFPCLDSDVRLETLLSGTVDYRSIFYD
jgi:hypothetical protein